MPGADRTSDAATPTLLTLGTLRLAAVDLTRPKPLLLLAYLAHEGATDRKRLARLFFPTALDARDALSTTVRRLAELVSTVSTTDSRLVARVTTDALLFQGLALRADPRTAIDAYTGPFLMGIDVRLEPELEEWVLQTRELLASIARDLHINLARTGLKRRQLSSAWRHAEAAVRLTETFALEPKSASDVVLGASRQGLPVPDDWRRTLAGGRQHLGRLGPPENICSFCDGASALGVLRAGDSS